MIKTISIEGIDHPVILARRKGARSIRLSIKSDGTIRVALPYGVPEILARKFVRDRADWIAKHHKPANILHDKIHIGKNHRIVVSATDSDRHSTRITDSEILVKLPQILDIADTKAQAIIRKASEKALLKEAEVLLPQRLKHLSDKYSLPFNDLTIKKMKSRWGACDNRNNITLNIYLIQLDWRLIDYVMCHELAHTKHHHHQATFWNLVAEIYPDYQVARKEIKAKPTDILPTEF